MLTLTPKASVPIAEAQGLDPWLLRTRPLADLEQIPLALGNRIIPLAELFTLRGDPTAGAWHFDGSIPWMHGLGRGMTGGRIEVAGDVGRHAGAEMLAGELLVGGGAGDWLGAEMRGGRIHVRGSAGDLAAAAYRGSRLGMQGGVVIVEGDVGAEAAAGLRRGLVIVGGTTGRVPGLGMIAGTLVADTLGAEAGLGVKRGTVLARRLAPETELLPSYAEVSGRCALVSLTLLHRHVRALAGPWPLGAATEPPGGWRLARGDQLALGMGELFLAE